MSKACAVAAVSCALLVLPACGGEEAEAPAPTTNAQVTAQLRQLADEVDYGCSNAAAIRRANERLSDMASRLPDREAETERIARRVVRDTRALLRDNCP